VVVALRETGRVSGLVVLNPLIIGTAKDLNEMFVGNTGDVVPSITMVKSIIMVGAATALVARALTIVMGFIGHFHVALAAGFVSVSAVVRSGLRVNPVFAPATCA